MKLRSIVLGGALIVAQFSYAQNFNLMRYDEDCSELKDNVGTFYNSIKYIPFTPNGDFYLSLGGEVWEELNYAVNEDWGKTI